VLREKHGGTEPEKFVHTLEKVDAQLEADIQNGSPTALSWYCRKAWGVGDVVKGLGRDIWEVEDYQKATLRKLLLHGELQPYKVLPPNVTELFYAAFHH